MQAIDQFSGAGGTSLGAKPKQGHERILIKKSMTDRQICIWCGELMTKGETAISLRNNPGTTLTLKKNLWLHARCRAAFAGHLMYDLPTQFES